MLKVFLRKWRGKRRREEEGMRKVNEVGFPVSARGSVRRG